MRIGIPRALLFYIYYPFWRVFFKTLGVKILLSPPTNKAIMAFGINISHSDICFPMKIAFGHIYYLRDKVDTIFIPRFISLEKGRYICPKFIGLPDMVRASMSGLPRIIDTPFDARRFSIDESYYLVGKALGKNRSTIRDAIALGHRKEEDFKRQIMDGNVISDVFSKRKTPQNGDLRIALIGRPYILYDSFASVDLIKILLDRGVVVFTAEMVDTKEINEKAKEIKKRIYYTYGKIDVGASFHYIDNRLVDGLIEVMSFECGPDSLLSLLIEIRARKANIPYMELILDEESGKAGIITRVEAFLDMIRRRKRKK